MSSLTREEQIRKNRHDLIRLAEAIEALKEVRRTSKALEKRRLRKRERNREAIKELSEQVEQIAKQNGLRVGESEEGAQEAEKGMWTERQAFFTPPGARDRYMTENPFRGGDR